MDFPTMSPQISHPQTDEHAHISSPSKLAPSEVGTGVVETGVPTVVTPEATAQSASGLAAALHFLRQSWLRIVAISGVLLVPCFWHRRIAAGDLASHTYNAWLVRLIERGQAPGLWLARQWQNTLFDTMLSGLGGVFGLQAAEKIAVSVAVLIFFWGAFALVSAIARRVPWHLAPAIAMFTYGWTFQEGFLNYYLAIGLAFFGLAIVAGCRGWERALVLALVPFVWTAHPLGLVLLAGGGIYIALAEGLPARRWQLFAGAATLLVFTRFYVAGHYSVLDAVGPTSGALRMFNGVDQLVLYGSRYYLPAYLLLIFLAVCVVADLGGFWGEKAPAAPYILPLQLYGLALLAAQVLPSGVTLPQYAAPANLLTERLTSVTAILACCLVGVARPQKWHLAGFATLAAVFFLFLYVDTGKIDRMEAQAERLERVIPPGQRILATIWPFVDSRLEINHIVDRACIGQCFSYGNYEPSSQQFRVRANPGNPYVLAAAESADASEAGQYVVQPQDLPVFQIYQCDLTMTELCMRELVAGEMNGRIGIHPTQPGQ
jgi:hypothetical protein